LMHMGLRLTYNSDQLPDLMVNAYRNKATMDRLTLQHP
jgi:hypothetical protein